jgi:hypothetical protein
MVSIDPVLLSPSAEGLGQNKKNPAISVVLSLAAGFVPF